MALIADIALAPFPRHIALHLVAALLLLMSFIVPARLELSRRYFFYVAILILVPAVIWFIFFTDPAPSIRFSSFHYLAGLYFLALLLIMVYKRREEADLLPILAFILLVMIFSGHRDPRTVGIYKICVALQTILVIFFSVLREHPLKKGELFRGGAYWKRIIITVGILLLMSYGIARFFVWTETKVNSLFLLTLDSLTFSPAFAGKTDIGAVQNLKGSPRIVLRIVSTSHPSYLVGKVFRKYSRGTWEADRSSRIVYPVKEEVKEKVSSRFTGGEGSVFNLTKGPGDLSEVDKATIFQTYYITALNTETLFAPRGALFSMLVSENLRIDDPGVIYTNMKGTRGEYRLACCPGDVIKGNESREALSAYLEPPPFSDQIRKLNSELVSRKDSPWVTAQNLQNYFHSDFTYGVAPNTAGSSDFLEEFLLKTKQGHCEYFATAMTLLLRQNNIPARYINGFLVDEYNRMGGYYVVREKDAHAWVEAYIAEKGWVTFDPTPPHQGQREEKSMLPAFIRDYYDLLKLRLHKIVSRIMAGDIKGLFAFIILQIRDLAMWLVASPLRACITVLLIISVTVLVMKRKVIFTKGNNSGNNNRKSRLQLSPGVRELKKLAFECERVLARKKLKRHFSDSLLELSRHAGSLSLDAKSLALVQEFISEYCILRFGRDEIHDDDILRMKNKLQVIKSLVR